MKTLVYFFQFVFVMFLFLIFKILGLKISSALGGKIFQILGPFFRSKNLIYKNIRKALPNINDKEIDISQNKCGIIMEEFLLNMYF